MMIEDDFVARRQGDWEELDRLLMTAHGIHRLPAGSISRSAALYRALSADLVHAHNAGYSGETVAYLDALAARAHNAMYSAPPYRLSAALEFLARDFPRAVRRRAGFFGLAAALFVIPGVFCFFSAKASVEFSVAVLPQEKLDEMEEAYSGKHAQRGEGEDTAMAGFYVNNNIGVAFRCFATGVLAGVGSIFFLVYNGVLMGTLAGALTRTGQGGQLLTFCCGHSSFELTAIVISGTAGLLMGYALVVTGGRTRWGSLRAHARELFQLVIGAAAMLVVAALLEGFWSASPVLPPVKWGAAVVFALLVGLYLGFAGRGDSTAVVARGSR